ncbi:trypsin beta-like [Prorops nasuta]|uniref:trypsin beta-like n=1 Tax=Prorops nasuta TaxID=863751 RepID=UPI0034CE304E
MIILLGQLYFGFGLLFSVLYLSNNYVGGYTCYKGYPVTINYTPSIVSVQYKNSHICTGIIVTTKFILTSASCLCKPAYLNNIPENKKLQIVASINDTSEIGNIIPAERVICPPSWNETGLTSNVAVLMVEGVINFNSTQALAPFSISKEVPEKGLCWFVGFNSSTEGVSSHLEYFYINLVRHKTCSYSSKQSNNNTSSSKLSSYTTACGRPEQVIESHLQDPRYKTDDCNWFGEGSMLACDEKFYGIYDTIIQKSKLPFYRFTKLTKIWKFLKTSIPEFNEIEA